MTVEQIIQTKRGEILAAAARHGAKNVRVFGSVARRETGPTSDVDFLVDLEPGRSLLDHAALILELKQLLGVSVDVASERGLRDRVRNRVLREAIPL